MPGSSAARTDSAKHPEFPSSLALSLRKHPETDIDRNPALFPGLHSFFIKWHTVGSRLFPRIEEIAPRDPAPPDLPPGVEYHHQPPQDQLNGFYNRAAVFISPSWTEGWGLPPAEALMCGGAIAVTRGGADEAFAIHEETALVSPIKDPAALAVNILRLIRDKELRRRLARQGHALIQQFTWDRSGATLEALMLDAVATKPTPSNAEIETTV